MTEENKKESIGFSIASLVLGIFGLVLFLMPYIAIFLSILAVVFSALQKPNNGMSTTGLVLGIIGILGNLFMLVIMFFVLSFSFI